MENNDGEVDYRHRHAFRQDVDHGKFPTFFMVNFPLFLPFTLWAHSICFPALASSRAHFLGVKIGLVFPDGLMHFDFDDVLR